MSSEITGGDIYDDDDHGDDHDDHNDAVPIRASLQGSGSTLEEAAALAIDMGCVSAVLVASGDDVTMAVNGAVVSHPSATCPNDAAEGPGDAAVGLRRRRATFSAAVLTDQGMRNQKGRSAFNYYDDDDDLVNHDDDGRSAGPARGTVAWRDEWSGGRSR